jgi:predicted RNase H-like HicB family nuclease
MFSNLRGGVAMSESGVVGQTGVMGMARYVYWRDDDHWLGYFEDYPDYVTQGESVEDLKEQLKDLHRDLTGGEIPGIRRIAQLSVA